MANVPLSLLSMRISDAAPFEAAVSITPSDTDELPDGPCRSIYVGGAGDVSAIDISGNTSIHKSVPAGFVICGKFKQVLSTGTTATDMLSYY